MATLEHVAIAANNHPSCADWAAIPTQTNPNGLPILAFGSGSFIALHSTWKSIVGTLQSTLVGHSDRVNVVRWIHRANRMPMLISGSADMTCRVWQYDQEQNVFKTTTVLTGHEASIHAISCLTLPDLSILVVSSASDGKIIVWKVKSDNEVDLVQTIERKANYGLALAMAFVPGTESIVLAVAGTNCRISLFLLDDSTKNFYEVTQLSGHSDWVQSLDFIALQNDDGHEDLMLASASQDKFIRLWRISKTRHQSPDSPEDQLSNLSLERLETKKHTISIGDDCFSVLLESVLMGHDDWVYSARWSAVDEMDENGNVQPVKLSSLRLLSASSDKTMMVWKFDAKSHIWINTAQMGEVGGRAGGFYGAVWYPSGSNMIAGYDAHGAIHIWHDQEGQWSPQIGITGHFNKAMDLSWDPKGRYIMTVSHDQTNRVFAPWKRDEDGKSVTTWHEIARPQIHGYDLHCVTFLDDFRFVAGSEGEKVARIFDMPQPFSKSLESISKTSILSNAIGAEALPMGAQLPPLGLSNKPVGEQDHDAIREVDTFSPQQAPLITDTLTTPPFEEHLLQHTLWPESQKLYGHGDDIYSLAATHDGSILASAAACRAGGSADNGAIRIWDVRSARIHGQQGTFREVQTPLKSHTMTITTLSFSSDDKFLLSAGRDRMWCIFERLDHGEYKLMASMPKAHARIIWDASWSPCNHFFVTGSRDKSVKFWNVATKACTATFMCDHSVTSVAFLPVSVNGFYYVAAGMENGTIVILKTDVQCATVEELFAIPRYIGHTMTVSKLAWRPLTSSSPFELATCSEDCSVRIFKIKL